MEINSIINEDYTTFQLEGRLDLNSSSEVKQRVKGSLDDGAINVILDLSNVEFINSSGLGTLVSILKDVRMVQGKLVLCCLAQYVQEIFEITQLSHIFEIFQSEEEAAASMVGGYVNASK